MRPDGRAGVRIVLEARDHDRTGLRRAGLAPQPTEGPAVPPRRRLAGRRLGVARRRLDPPGPRRQRVLWSASCRTADRRPERDRAAAARGAAAAADAAHGPRPDPG